MVATTLVVGEVEKRSRGCGLLHLGWGGVRLGRARGVRGVVWEDL